MRIFAGLPDTKRTTASRSAVSAPPRGMNVWAREVALPCRNMRSIFTAQLLGGGSLGGAGDGAFFMASNQ
jgi:hypothetical protein